jgi:hypothetical protein
MTSTPATLPADPHSHSRSINPSLAFPFVLLWPAASLLCVSNSSWLDTLNAAGLFVAIVAGLLLTGLGAKLAATATGRLWSVVTYVFAVLVLSPAFLRGVPMLAYGEGRNVAALSAAFAAAVVLLLFVPKKPDTSERPSALISFLRSGRVRLNLLFFGALLLGASAQLSGQPLAPIVPQLILLGLALVSIPSLFTLAGQPSGARLLGGSAALALGISAVAGTLRYQQAHALTDDVHALLAQDKVEEAQAVAKHAADENEVLKSPPLTLRLETEWAEYAERKGDLWNSFSHWQKVADLKSIPRADFPPALRVMWKAGDSMSVWRKLVYDGFPAIRKPEVTQGVLELGDRPGGDVRAKLAAALLACELQLKDDECKRRLEAVQNVVPNEVSSHILLEKYGVNSTGVTLVLPPDLLVGHEPSFHAVTGMTDSGSIEEQGETSSIVVLSKGHYEMLITAHGTPLKEEWPIIHIELNGQEIGRTQVVTSEDHPIPFTFDVNRADAYRLRVVFENYVDELIDGKISRRGLSIGAITFRRRKE